MKHNHRRIVNQQITDLLNKAAQRPGKDDPLGIVGLGSTLVAVQVWVKQAELDMAYQEARAALIGTLEARIGQRTGER